MELSDSQFERLVTMLADNRAAIRTVKNELSLEIQAVKRDLGLRIEFVAGKLEAVEEDLGKVQTTGREHGALLESIDGMTREQAGIIQAMDQALVGVTQLSKTSFDMIESLNKHVLGESGTLHHGEGETENRDPAELG
ncbi:MAG: hypothetical protein V4567_05360 [Pseudomonadota bacterium]